MFPYSPQVSAALAEELKNSFPTRARFSSVFGFPIPAAFHAFLRAIWETSTNASVDFSDVSEAVLGMDLSDNSFRYQGTPPELFYVMTMGVDGVHYGYVIHAPELNLEDHPIGHFCAMELNVGIYMIGANTPQGLENLMSWQLQEAEERKNFPLVRANAIRQEKWITTVASKLGLAPGPEKANRMYGPKGNGIPIRPAIPSKWKFAPTTDGIGVLAPVKTFREFPPTPCKREDNLKFGKSALEEGFPGTALFYLREAYSHDWTIQEINDKLKMLLYDTYMALGRPELAEIARKRKLALP